jgi:hypothetical protein
LEEPNGISAARNGNACNVSGAQHLMAPHSCEHALLKMISRGGHFVRAAQYIQNLDHSWQLDRS